MILPIVWTGKEREIVIDKKLDKQGDDLKILILLLGKDEDTVKVKILVDHAATNTTSRVIVKGVLKGKSAVDIDGLVRIEAGAKGSNAWLAAHLLLLSDKASGRVVPNLEIIENDVKAGHATSVGQVNQEEMFYLMSRGLTEKEASGLIVGGFVKSMVDEFPLKMRNKLKRELE